MIKLICRLIGHPLRKGGWIFSWEEMKLIHEKCPVCEESNNKQGGAK